MGVEPTSEAWEASILPMNYSRMCICVKPSLTQMRIKIKRKFIDNPFYFIPNSANTSGMLTQAHTQEISAKLAP